MIYAFSIDLDLEEVDLVNVRIHNRYNKTEQQRTKKGPEIRMPLQATLEEIYNGRIVEVSAFFFLNR